MEEHVGGVWPVGQVTDLIDHQYMGVRVGYQRLLKVSPLAGIGEIFDEFRGGGEQRLKAVLNSAVGDGHRQMGLPSAGLAVQDQRPALGDEVDPEIGADQRFPKSGLQREVELVDGLEEGEVRVSGTALDAGLLPSRYFFGQQQSEEIPIRPAFLLGPARDLFVDPAHVRQVQTPEVNLELALGELQALRCVVD